MAIVGPANQVYANQAVYNETFASIFYNPTPENIPEEDHTGEERFEIKTSADDPNAERTTRKMFEYAKAHPERKIEFFNEEHRKWFSVSSRVLNFFEKHKIPLIRLFEFSQRLSIKWVEETVGNDSELEGDQLFEHLKKVITLIENAPVSGPYGNCFIRDPKFPNTLVLSSNPLQTGFGRLVSEIFIRIKANVCLQYFDPFKELCPQDDRIFRKGIKHLIIHNPYQNPALFKVISDNEKATACFSKLQPNSIIFLVSDSAGIGGVAAYNLANHLANHLPEKLPPLKIIAPMASFDDLKVSAPSKGLFPKGAMSKITSFKADVVLLNFYLEKKLVGIYEIDMKDIHPCFMPNSFLCPDQKESRTIFFKSMLPDSFKKSADRDTPFEYEAKFSIRFFYKNLVNADIYEISDPGNNLFKLGFSPKHFEKLSQSGVYFSFFYKKLLEIVLENRSFDPYKLGDDDILRIKTDGLTKSDVIYGDWTPQKYINVFVERLNQ
ncbi:MAG: hypothetical protein WC371_04525, partial [Parachlamydiales bacterium]